MSLTTFKAYATPLTVFAMLTNVFALTSFLDLGHDMLKPGWPAFEEWLRSWFPARSPVLSQVAYAFTWLGNHTTLFGLSLLVMLSPWPAPKRKDKAAFIGVTLGSTVANLLLKTWFRRPRPGVDYNPLVEEPYYSFPSGHTMISLCVYGFVTYLACRSCQRRGQQLCVIFAMGLVILMIGLSRVYLAAHYPGDVLGGFSAGWACLWVAIWFHQSRSKLRRTA